MHGRRNGRKPTLALWMLVALADLAILTTAAGAFLMLTVLTTLAVLAGGVVVARRIARRSEATHKSA